MRRLNVTAVALYLALGTMFASVPLYVTEELGGSKAMAGLAISIFFIAAVVTRPVVGRLADVHGRRLFIVIPPFAIAVLLVAMLGARWVPAVLAVRFGLGVFGSAFYTAAVTTSTDLNPHGQASAVAVLSISIYLGFALGPTLGETLVHGATALAWLVPAALAVVAGAIVWGIPETRPAGDDATPAPDPGAYEELAPGLTGAGPAPTVPRATAPGTRLWLGVLHPAAVLPGLTLLTLGLGYQAITSQSALYATSIDMATATPLFAAFALSILGIRLVSGRLADTIGPVRVMFPGVACYIVGFGLLARFAAPVAAVVGIAFVGAGWALVFPAVTAWLSGRVPDAERGSALGSLISFMDIGQGTGGYLVGGLADAFGFGTAFVAPAVLAAAGGIVLAVAVRRPGPTAPGGS